MTKVAVWGAWLCLLVGSLWGAEQKAPQQLNNVEFQLPAWEPPADWEPVPVVANGRAGRIFFDEYLPAIMSRTLVCNSVDFSKEPLSWVFTGPRAGLTVKLTNGSIGLEKRYYDSFGFSDPDPQGRNRSLARFPELSRTVTIPYRGTLRAVTVLLDHRASVEVLLNGQSVHREIFAEDLSRHQLQVSAKLEPGACRMLRPQPAEAVVVVEPGQRRQIISGFGGIASMPSYHMLSKLGQSQWWHLLAEYGLNIQREYPAGQTLKPDYSNLGTLDAAVPHYYADNFPNGETVDFDYLKCHRRLPASQVWFEYWWQLPPWTNGKADAYAASVLEYCRRVERVTGRAPEVLGVQNEKLMNNWADMVTRLRSSLDGAGYQSCRIHMNDAGYLHSGSEWLKQYRANAAAWQALTYTASHEYDFQSCFTDPDQFDATLRQFHELSDGKPYLSTEICVNDPRWQMASYRLAFQMAQHYHKTLTLGQAEAICYCWLLLDVEQPSFGWTRTLFKVDRANGFVPAASSCQLRCFGAFSRRIRSGMTRLETQSNEPQLLASAYAGEGGKATLVLLNRTARPLRVRVEWAGATFKLLERVGPYEPNALEPAPGAGITIPGGAIATLSNVELMALPSGLDMN